MELIRKKIYYSNCSLEEVKELINNKEAYPVVYPHLWHDEDEECYPELSYSFHLSKRIKHNDDVEIENVYYFWQNRKEIIAWLEENYNGLVYRDKDK